MKDLKKFEKFAIQTAVKAGEKLYQEFRKKDASNRSTGKEIKTLYDNLADKIIKESIEKSFPTHSYVTEETGLVEKDKSDYLWVIDPLDGTSNFVNHNPFFSVSIALWYKGKPIVGVVEAPAIRERYVAVAGKGAYLYDLLRNKKRKARVSGVKDLNNSYWVFCEGGEDGKKGGKRIARIFSHIYPNAKEFRKLGSAAIELAWVGTARAEGYVTTKIRLWDIGAGMLFVKEAGGKNLHFNGSPYKWKDFLESDNFNLMATNGKIKLNLDKF